MTWAAPAVLTSPLKLAPALPAKNGCPQYCADEEFVWEYATLGEGFDHNHILLTASDFFLPSRLTRQLRNRPQAADVCMTEVQSTKHLPSLQVAPDMFLVKVPGAGRPAQNVVYGLINVLGFRTPSLTCKP